jgi:uncharacterized surface protein with fasciclin (FAS1) repeats
MFSTGELVCRVSSLSTLCASITQTGLESALNEGNWTIFVPTNNAFFNIGENLGSIFNNTDVLTDLILFHAFDGLLFVDDLLCGSSIQMANGQTSSTVCQDDTTYQVGDGNSADNLPQIVASNINTCNSVLHIIDEVILPATFEPVPQTVPDCKTIGASASTHCAESTTT